MITAETLAMWIDDLPCDECGRTWSEITSNPSDGPDERSYVKLTGRVGTSLIRTTLCPQCVDELADVVVKSAGYFDVLCENRSYFADEYECGNVPILLLIASVDAVAKGG